VARVVIIIGITHNPLHIPLVSQPRSQWSADTLALYEHGELMREKLRRAEPEALVTVGNDHFHQFFMDNMPAFVMGKMPVFDGTFTSETRDFNIPTCKVPGDVELADQLLAGAMERGVDFAFSNELKIDHSIVVPLMFVRPEMDLPIVPISANCMAPPLPTARRFYEVGRVIRAALDDIPGDRRIGVVVSGHLSLDVGGPTQLSPGPADETFDNRAVRWLAEGDAETAIRECGFDRLIATGNVTPAFLNYLLALGVANGEAASFAEGVRRSGSSQGFFAWELAKEAVA
jgi:protocatechuate 4,5-dioxygenase beta chain